MARRKPWTKREPPVFQLYRKTLDRLSAQGLARWPQETPHEFLSRARRESLAGADALACLTKWYTEARYGQVEISDDVLTELKAQAATIGRQGRT